MQEFDVIGEMPLSAEGSSIHYVAATVEAGALKPSAPEIWVRADGINVGRIKPGERVELNRKATQWTVRANGYARVRIGNGRVSGPGGVQETTPAVMSCFGTEWRGGVKSAAVAGLYSFAGVRNASTDKMLAIRRCAIIYGNTGTDMHVSSVQATAAAVVTTADVAVNAHGPSGIVPGIEFVNGTQVAIAPDTGTEYTADWTTSIYTGISTARQIDIASERAPILIPPGDLLIVRPGNVNSAVALYFEGSTLAYSAQ